MRLLSCANARNKQWFFSIFYREVGAPQPFVVGQNALSFGKGPDVTGRLGVVSAEVKDDYSSLSVFPGSRILAVVMSDQPINAMRYAEQLTPADEVELVKPSDIVVVSDPSLAMDVVNNSGGGMGVDSVRRDLEALNGHRRKFFAQGRNGR